MERLTGEDLSTLWPDEAGWPQDIGAVAILEGGNLLDTDGRFRLEDVRSLLGFFDSGDPLQLGHDGRDPAAHVLGSRQSPALFLAIALANNPFASVARRPPNVT